MDRDIVFKALVGSNNYNLQTPESDKDFKVFTFPDFTDLYYGRMQASSFIGKEVDYDYHDIRKIVDLFWKANLNFIEVLYSDEVNIVTQHPEIMEIFVMRKELVTMNLPYLYSSCKGMFYNKMKYLEKGTEGTQHLVEKYHYDTKQAMHAYRILDFGIKYAISDFDDFKAVMKYFKDSEREWMLQLKNGYYSLEEFKQLAELTFKKYETYENKYMSMQPNEETKQKLEALVMSLVRRKIMYGGYDPR